MYFEHSGPKLSAGDIQRVEGLIGCRLPSDYREFLLTHNGGVPRPSGFTVVVDGLGAVDNCVEVLHSINTPELGNNLEAAIRSDRDPRQSHEQFEIPIDAIWIGTAMGGEIVLFVEGLHAGEVWLKRGVEDHNNPMEGMCLLALTFDEFLTTLTPCEWDPPSPDSG